MLAVYKLGAWLTGPLGRLVLIALAFLAWTTYHRWDAASECEAAQLQAEMEETNRLLRIAREVADKASLRADVREAELERLRREADAIAEETESVGSCPIPPDLRERLRAIR